MAVKRSRLQRVEADREAAQAGGAKGGGVIGELDTVGGQRNIGEARLAGEDADELRGDPDAGGARRR